MAILPGRARHKQGLLIGGTVFTVDIEAFGAGVRDRPIIPIFSTSSFEPHPPLASWHYTMIPTPDLSHLTRKDYDLVYEPAGTKITRHPSRYLSHPHISPTAEDTFILLDALEKDADELKQLQPSICLEVGWVNLSTR